MAIKKSTTAIVPWKQQLAERAKKATSSEQGVGGEFISIKGGKLTFKGGNLGNDINVVVIAAAEHHARYEGDYNPNNPQSPTCYSFRVLGDDAPCTPHEKCYHAVSESCESCPDNEFGTAERGKGKRCKEGRRLAVILAAEAEENIEKASVAYLNVPPTSIRNWAGYVHQLGQQGLPPEAVVTTIHVEMNDSEFPEVSFSLLEPIGEDSLQAVFARADLEQKPEKIGFPYPEYKAEEKPQSTRGNSNKFAAKRGLEKPAARPGRR